MNAASWRRPALRSAHPFRYLAVVAVLVCVACGGGGGNSSPVATPSIPPATPTPTPVPIPSPPQTFVGAGDIGVCGSAAADQTGKLLDGIGGTVFAVGDLGYFSGTAQEFRDCFEPVWGRHKARMRPAPGNHEYVSPGAQPYYSYFGFNAGSSGLGYYSYDLGDWHAIALNSTIGMQGPSAQTQWLQADLAEHANRCTVAYWHHPLFSSGANALPAMRDIFRILYDGGADIVINGHDHFYERFGPQDADGRPQPDRGIREFIVGTGGAPLYDFFTIAGNSERRIKSHGVLRLTLNSTSYSWEFIPIPGSNAGSDSGTANCH